jgi:hypothetical protein
MSDSALEAEARDIIVSLGMLLEYSGMSMIVCFDQLDGMRDQGLIGAFGDAIHVLVDQVRSMLPLAFVRLDTWENFDSHLDIAVTRRLVSNPIRLWGCTLDQARELVRLRIESRFKEGVDEKFEWLMGQLNGRLKKGSPPSEVIALANRAIVQTHEPSQPGTETVEEQEDDPIEIFGVKYRQERDEVAGHLEMWPPDTERMLKALSAYLKGRPEYSGLQPGPDKYVTLVGKHREPDGSEVDCAFILNTAANHKTVQASFDRGVKFLRAHPQGHCYYISDERCAFRDRTRWKAVHEVKDVFDQLDGRTLFLTHSLAATWYGLTSLIFKLEEGDISINTSAGSRTATEKDFELYMKEGFKEEFLPLTLPAGKDEKTPPPPSPPSLDVEKVEEKVIALLKNSPMHTMVATMLLGGIQKAGEKIFYEQLLEFLNKRGGKFSLFPSGDGTIVMLK